MLSFCIHSSTIFTTLMKQFYEISWNNYLRVLTMLLSTNPLRPLLIIFYPVYFPHNHRYTIIYSSKRCKAWNKKKKRVVKKGKMSSVLHFHNKTPSIGRRWARRQGATRRSEVVHRLPLGRRASTSSWHLLTDGQQGGHKLLQTASLPLTA